MFGADTPTLQELAMKLLSQCASSSGCERNWSIFAFIHTKLRSRLGHKKLHQLVFVNYNLRLRIQRAGSIPDTSEFDPVGRMMDLSFYRQRNAIRDWMEYGRSNATPALDENSDYNDTPIPSALFTSMADENENWDQWADKNIGDTHVGKRKTRVAPSQQQKKKFKRNNDREEEEFRSDDTTPEPSGDDGGRGFDGDDDDEDDTGGSDDGDAGGSGWVRGSGGAGGSSGQVSPLRFTGEINFTHVTQDQDHGAPTSQRQTRSGRRARSTPKYAPHLQLPPPYRGRLPPPPLPQQPIHLTFWLPSAYGLQVCICLSVFIQSFVHLSYSLHLINVGTIL